MNKNYIIDKYNCAPCLIKENKKNSSFKSCYSKNSLMKIANIWNKNNNDKKISRIFIKKCMKLLFMDYIPGVKALSKNLVG